MSIPFIISTEGEKFSVGDRVIVKKINGINSINNNINNNKGVIFY